MTKRTQSTKKSLDTSEKKPGIYGFLKTRQAQTILGTFLILFSVFLCIAFISFFFNWQEDQSALTKFTDKTVKSQNLLGKIGANLSHFLIYKGFGIGAFVIALQTFLSGVYILFKKKFASIIVSWNWNLFAMLWLSISLGFVHNDYALLSGIIGFEINEYSQAFVGKTGLVILLSFILIAYTVLRYKVTFDKYLDRLKRKKEEKNSEESLKKENLNSESLEVDKKEVSETISLQTEKKEKSRVELSLENLQPTITNHSDVSSKKEEATLSIEKEITPHLKTETTKEKEVEINVTETKEEEYSSENLSNQLVKDFGEFDPTLELGNFKFPTFNLLKQYNETISIDPEELEANKDKIVETLKNYKIGIAEIKATVGPTITLYEIVPEAGIRISKIKNLEDDIALSLSALGIRIIAPIP